MIDVAMTRAGVRRADVAVVIDVLRASSTVSQALASGYRRVLCVDSLERAAGLRAPGRVLAGERHCIKPPDFDQGNSPLEAMHRRGNDLILATTNGTPTIVVAARQARTVLLACLLNLDAAIDALHNAEGSSSLDVQIVCSGTSGAPALDDVYLAGRLCAGLMGPRTDAARVAEVVARAYGTPLQALEASAGAAMLTGAGLKDDVAYCARESTLEVVPRVVAASAGVAVVVPSVLAVGAGAVDGGDTVPL